MSDPWFKFYPSDWLSGTRGLTPAETGVYVTLVCMLYENEGRLPRNDARADARLARRCGCTAASFRKILSNLLLEEKLTEDNGFLTNMRVQKELAERADRVQKSTSAAHRKWATYRQKNQLNQDQNAASASRELSTGSSNNQNQNQSHFKNKSSQFGSKETPLQRLSRGAS